MTLTEIDPASLSKTDPPERTRVRDRHTSPVDKEEGKGYKENGSECANVEVGSVGARQQGAAREGCPSSRARTAQSAHKRHHISACSRKLTHPENRPLGGLCAARAIATQQTASESEGHSWGSAPDPALAVRQPVWDANAIPTPTASKCAALDQASRGFRGINASGVPLAFIPRSP